MCPTLNWRLQSSGEHLLLGEKSGAQTHTRSSTSVIAAATVESSTSTAGRNTKTQSPNLALSPRQLETISKETYLKVRPGIGGHRGEQTMKVGRRSAENEQEQSRHLEAGCRRCQWRRAHGGLERISDVRIKTPRFLGDCAACACPTDAFQEIPVLRLRFGKLPTSAPITLPPKYPLRPPVKRSSVCVCSVETDTVPKMACSSTAPLWSRGLVA